MTKWIRFEQGGKTGIGTLEGDTIALHSGNMFAGAKPTGETLKLSDVQVLTPCDPSKMICLWNNFHQLAAKNDFKEPKEPLWFLKAPNSYWPANRPIQRPATYAGKIIYEGELGVVIGKKCFNISEAEAGDYIFGYTCVNDVTAVDLLRKDKSFEQWARSKSFDTFGVFGPVIATGIDPMKLSIKTILNGKERQNYPVADMFFPPHKLVAAISKDVTLMPGDVIACGTSLGAGTMGDAHNIVEIVIDGVGSLGNVFDQVLPSPYLLGAPPKQKKICVVGAGAIGGLLAAKFALAGEDVTVIDQGAHLAAIQKNGLKLEWHDGKVQTAKMKAVNKATEAGKQDIVVLAVKAHFLDQVVRDIDSLLGPDTIVLTVQNGLPWWYFQKLGGKYDNHRLQSLDPSGVLTKHIDPNRIIGCVVYPAAAAISARRHSSRRGRSLSDRRTRRQGDPAGKGIARRLHQGRAEIHGTAGHPLGNLAEGMGQPLVQPDLGADPRDAGGHLPVRRDARTRGDHDEGSPGHRAEARRHLPRHHRKTHCRRGSRRRAQNVDAAGRRGRPLARDRGADRFDPGNGQTDQYAGARHRIGLCAGEASEQGHAAGRRRREGREDKQGRLGRIEAVDPARSRSVCWIRASSNADYPRRSCARSASPKAWKSLRLTGLR